MVETKEAIISSTITSTLITAAHGVTHYTVGNPETFMAAGVNEAGVAVFATSWILSYTGMKGYLPF